MKETYAAEHETIIHVHEKEEDGILIRNLPQLSKSMTFANMFKQSKISREILKNIEWLFPAVCKRKDQNDMTETERSRFLCAFHMINSDGTLGKLVDIHNEMHMQHTNARLLPWHRNYVYLFEEALHNYHPDVCVPYWDWTKPEEQHFPAWLLAELPTVITPTRTINVVRSPGTDSQLASIASSTPSALSKTDILTSSC